MEYYERKRQAIEATIAEIHKAQSAYKKPTEEINYTAKGLANLEFKIKNRNDFCKWNWFYKIHWFRTDNIGGQTKSNRWFT